MKYTPRDYQDKAVIDITNYILHDYKGPGLAVLPTAAGKSWVIADMISRFGDPATLVIQPAVELLKQNYTKYTASSLNGSATLYSASAGKKEVSNVTYGTPLSMKNDADKFSHVRLVIIDECHLMTARDSVLDRFIASLHPDVKVIGLTATPIRLENVGYYYQLSFLTNSEDNMWEEVIHVTQVDHLYKDGYLTPLRFTTFNFNMRNVGTSGSDFDMDEVSEVAREQGVLEFTVNLIKESVNRGKKKILLFTPTVKDAYDIKEQLGNGFEVVSSKTKKAHRETYIDDFVNGGLTGLINYGTLTTGFDAPEIDLIVCVRPTMSYGLWYQLVGRGIRIAEGKTVCDVVDLSGNYREFGDPKDLVIENYKAQGWGMYVKDYLITDIPIGTKLHKSALDFSERKVGFGKFKNHKWKHVPGWYIKYMIKSFDFSSNWSKQNVLKPLRSLGYKI